MKKRDVFKNALARRENTNLTLEAIREVELEFEGLRPYSRG